MLAERRQTLHANIVEAIERLHVDRLVEHVDRLAYHAGRGQVWAKAHIYGVQAGHKALAQSANRASLDAFQGALAALEHLPETTEAIAENIDIRFQLRDAHFILSEMDRILPHIERARTLAERIGDRRRLALAALYESGYHWIEGKYHLAVEAGMRGLTAAEELESWELSGLAHYRIGQSLLFLGDHVAAADHFRTSVAALDHDAGRTLLRFGGVILAFVASFASWAMAELGEFAESEAAGLMGFELAVKANHAYSISVAAFGLAQGRLRQGRIADAIRVLEQGYEQTKLHTVEAAVDQLIARLVYAYSRTGRMEEARALAQTMAPELTRLSFLSSVHFVLAGLSLEVGRIDEVRDAAREVRQTAMVRGEKATVAWLEHLLGDLAMSNDPADPATAAEHYRAAAAIASELGMRPLAVECHFGLGAVARRAGRENEAQSEFQSALELAEAMGITSAAERARQHLHAT